jgi:hypothetical protein
MRFYFVRRVDAGRHLDIFLISAVVTVLSIRMFLAASGYPQLGGNGLHIAHMLWGGLGMLFALIILISLEGRLWLWLAALLGGIGFGAFIDELGKFITSDNDYFFQPTFAIMYLIFIGLYLLTRTLGRFADPSPDTCLVNAFDLAKEAVIRDLDERERVSALALLSRCDQDDPVVASVTRLVRDIAPVEPMRRGPLMRARSALTRTYDWLIGRRWFAVLLVAGFAVASLLDLVAAVLNLTDLSGVFAAASLKEVPAAAFASLGSLMSALVAGGLVLVGVLSLRRARLSAYRWFERSLLVDIFVGTFFDFWINQLSALTALVVYLVILAVVRYMIHQERGRAVAQAFATA